MVLRLPVALEEIVRELRAAGAGKRLRVAVEAVDPTRLPLLTPHLRRVNDGRSP